MASRGIRRSALRGAFGRMDSGLHSGVDAGVDSEVGSERRETEKKIIIITT